MEKLRSINECHIFWICCHSNFDILVPYYGYLWTSVQTQSLFHFTWTHEQQFSGSRRDREASQSAASVYVLCFRHPGANAGAALSYLHCSTCSSPLSKRRILSALSWRQIFSQYVVPAMRAITESACILVGAWDPHLWTASHFTTPLATKKKRDKWVV